jgi:hypothetical protein
MCQSANAGGQLANASGRLANAFEQAENATEQFADGGLHEKSGVFRFIDLINEGVQGSEAFVEQ